LFEDAKVLYSSTLIWMLAFPLVPPEVALTERRSWRPWDELAALPPVVVLVEDWD
jgi:hypothetical protein